MRVAFIAGEYPPQQGGLGDYTRELGRALIEAGHAVRVVTVADDGVGRHAEKALSPTTGAEASTPPTVMLSGAKHLLWERWQSRLLTAFGVTVDAHVPWRAAPDDVEPAVGRVVRRWNWRAWPSVRAAVRDADIVHLQYQTAAYAMHPVANALPWLLRRFDGRRGQAVVTTYHDTRILYLFPKAGRVREWVTDGPARGSDAVIATNAEDAARLAKVARRLAVIPIGSNIAPTAGPEARAAWRAHWGIGPDTPLLVYFGFVNRAKGADTLVRALAQVRGAGLPARLLMLGGQVGASDPTNQVYLAEVRALAHALGVADALIWTDFLPEAEVSAALVSADMATLPYRDGVSLQRGTLMAALAHGLPIVTTQPPVTTPSPLPALVDDVNATLVPPDDAAALARAICALWDDPARRARLGAAARQLAQAFRWERIAQQHIELYGNLLSERAERP